MLRKPFDVFDLVELRLCYFSFVKIVSLDQNCNQLVLIAIFLICVGNFNKTG